MIRLYTSICIEAPAHAVWARLAKLEDVELWAEPIIKASCDGALSQGVGAERTCLLQGNVTIQERWTEWEEGKSFKYEGVGIPMFKYAANRWTVQPQGAQTLVISQAELRLRWGLLGRMLEPFAQFWLRRVAPNTLAAFKYLVETGEPYPGRHGDLPRAAVAC
ncbi:MAG: SRPBCC family protein [Caldilineaceae bacterium]